MLMNRDFQIWQCTAAKNDGRPTLTMVCLEVDPVSDDQEQDDLYPGKAVATDGFILAVVPVQFSPDDKPGLLAPDILKKAAAIAKRQRVDDLEVDLSKPDLAGLRDGSWLPRYGQLTAGDLGSFPDYEPVIPSRLTANERSAGNALMSIALQPGYLANVSAAIGCQVAISGRGSGSGSGIPRIVPGKANAKGSTYEPFLIEPSNRAIAKGKPVAPFGLIMPMAFNPSDPDQIWTS